MTPNIVILGGSKARRLPIFSIIIRFRFDTANGSHALNSSQMNNSSTLASSIASPPPVGARPAAASINAKVCGFYTGNGNYVHSNGTSPGTGPHLIRGTAGTPTSDFDQHTASYRGKRGQTLFSPHAASVDMQNGHTPSPVGRLKGFQGHAESSMASLFLHHNFVCSLLNDLFGIQARGGCACAGPYALDLLGISETMAHLYENVVVGR
ncbi:unnamed protein product [Protopolystoma xenopodis]|uniref:Aminotransferase class V domain-containing protein n=1 Tax=Protopolystoma xenopodis TaxID=117903 RepID=A0A3S5CUU2_9PLAT|nr:unnamed protein product [Protopolystoma xenopodis]